jgi:hypothetical protein
MPVLAFLVLVGLVVTSLVAIDLSGVPKISQRGYLPLTNRGRVAAPAPAPDMTSQLVLAAQPAPEVPAKVEAASPPGDRSATTHQKQTAEPYRRAALEARAEALPTKKRVTRAQPPVYRRNNASVAISTPPWVREFGLSGTN